VALYTFFLCQPDGDARSFEILDLEDDAAAYDQSAVMLDQHLSAAYVAVWIDERRVCAVARDEAATQSALASRFRPNALL